MKFALAEWKIVLCNILKNFELRAPIDTPSEIKEFFDGIVRQPYNNVKVIFKKRD